MDNFNFDLKSKRMPYAPLAEGFFEEFNSATMDRIAQVESKNVRSRRGWSLLFSTSMAIAASIVVVLGYLLLESPTQRAINDFDSSLDLYVEALTDEELNSYYSEFEDVDVFYANL